MSKREEKRRDKGKEREGIWKTREKERRPEPSGQGGGEM
jgi:hypothetical protein